VHRSAISHSRLMRESTDRIASALRSDDDKEHVVAHRLAESSRTWQLWENEHSGLMRQVADFGVLRNQAAALRHTALRLIHGKALFEYLRRNEVRGAARTQILNYFYPTRGYRYAVISEHGAYVRKACSYLCTGHVGTDLVHDPAFLDPMQHYESPLLPLLKHQLNEWRWIILNPRESLPRVKREREMRRATGETQRLPHLKISLKEGA
jgi:hypothetical protein